MDKNTHQQRLRPATAKTIIALARQLIDPGVVTAGELTVIHDALLAAARGDAAATVPPRLIDGKAVSELLGISYSQFRALEAEQAFPFRRRMLGNKTVRYYAPEVVTYMENATNEEKK